MCENLDFFLKTCSNFELYVVLIMKLSEARQTTKNNTEYPVGALHIVFFVFMLFRRCYLLHYSQACSLYRKFSLGLPKKKHWPNLLPSEKA